MERYKIEFLEFLVESEVLLFGEFTLKSGRKSPYFFNSGKFDTGKKIERLGYFYACRIREFDPLPTVLYGPAYKGIPLAVAASIALQTHFGIETGYCFDRKEAKTHGDKGLLVGRMPDKNDRVILVDDVITDGRTKIEAVERLHTHTPATISGLVIALDREEKTPEGDDPVSRLVEATGLEVRAIASLSDILGGLAGREIGGRVHLDEEQKRRIETYRKEYGIVR